MKYEVVIPDWRPASLNQLMHCHWSKKAKIKKAERDLVAIFCRDVPRALLQRGVSLRITLAKGMRAFDADNCWKGLLDALVKCRRLVNDNPRWCHQGPITYERGERLSTTIILEDYDGPEEGAVDPPAARPGRMRPRRGRKAKD